MRVHAVMRGTGIGQAKVLPHGLQLLGSLNYTAQYIVLEMTAPIADVTREIADGMHVRLAHASPLTLTTDQTSQDIDRGDTPSHCYGSPYCAACVLCTKSDNEFTAVYLRGGHLRLQESAE